MHVRVISGCAGNWISKAGQCSTYGTLVHFVARGFPVVGLAEMSGSRLSGDIRESV